MTELPDAPNANAMQTGAVAMIDALGFKGIWRRKDVAANPPLFIAALTLLATEINAHAKSIRPSGPSTAYTLAKATMLSDTIIIGVTAHIGDETKAERESTQRWIRTAPIAQAASFVRKLIRIGARGPLRLSFRGCISYGDFLLDDRFMLGHAVDEAAELHQLAEGAFVWLTPSAMRVRGAGAMPFEAQHFAAHAIPLKSGSSYNTLAVSPFDPTLDIQPDVDALMRDLLAPFEPEDGRAQELSVAIKQQNTEAFLQQAAAAVDVKLAERVRAYLARSKP